MRLTHAVALVALLAPHPASAAVTGAFATASVVVNLGPVPDRSRVGAALEVGGQLFWHNAPYYSTTANRVAPLATVSAHLAWTRPVTSAQLAVTGGAMYPLVLGDAGFIPLLGAQVGVGLGLATDGAAGPVLVGQVIAPFTEARFDTFLWRGIHAPRLSAGVSLENCCSYLL